MIDFFNTTDICDGSDSLSNVSCLNLVDEKHVIERRDLTKSNQPNSPKEISHRQNR